MAVGWASGVAGTTLALSGAYQTIQESAADWVIGLAANQHATVTFAFNPPASPTEKCVVVILASSNDGTTYDTPGNAYKTLTLENTEDPSTGTLVIEGIEQFKIQAVLRDDDGTIAGGTDTSTLIATLRIATES